MGDKDEEKPGSGGNTLLGNDTTLHYKTTAGYATILAKWGDTETPPEVPADFHDITVVNGFLSTFYHEIQTDGLKLSAMRVPNYSNIDVYPDPVCGLIVDRFEMTGDLNGEDYLETAVWDSEYESVSFYIKDGEQTPQILTITGIGVPEIAPEFKVQSLVLSGQLGVNFFMDLSMLSDEEKAASYMEYTVNSKTTKADFDSSFRDAGGKGYYGFTCYVSSIQMADEITAVFHYDEGKTVEKTYSVKEYLATLESMNLDAKTETLVHAIADYGYYAQFYLAAVNGWTVGADHTEMDMHYTDAFDYDEIKAAVAGYAIQRDFDSNYVESVKFSLNMSAETKLNVYITPKNSEDTVTATATYDGVTYTAAKQSNGQYKITIPNLSAHQLGDEITISVTVGSYTFPVKVSALSYVKTVLDKTDTDADTLKQKDAVAAFYKYYEAAMAY